MNLAEMNVWGIVAATVATMALGFLWYSPVLFGNAWAKLREVKKEEMSGGGPMTYVLTALTALGGAFLLSLLLTLDDQPTTLSGMWIGLLIGASIALKIGMNHLFENAPLRLYLITIGYHLVSYLVSGLIIGALQS